MSTTAANLPAASAFDDTRFTGRLLQAISADRGGQFLLSALLLLGIAVPILHLAVPDGSALHMSSYTVTLLGKYLCYAMLAIAVDLVWGYCGILSLGHAAFFFAGWLCHGHVLNASDRAAWCIW